MSRQKHQCYQKAQRGPHRGGHAVQGSRDRAFLIKGSTKTIRLASTAISAIIKNSDRTATPANLRQEASNTLQKVIDIKAAIRLVVCYNDHNRSLLPKYQPDAEPNSQPDDEEQPIKEPEQATQGAHSERAHSKREHHERN